MDLIHSVLAQTVCKRMIDCKVAQTCIFILDKAPVSIRMLQLSISLLFHDIYLCERGDS